MMQSALSIIALASTVTAVVPKVGFEFRDSVPMSKRQTSGPAYECHANCGYAIQNSRQGGYCEDDEWLHLLEDCLDCALEFDIWTDYGDKVAAAAKKCGLDATPKPANEGDEASSDVPGTTIPASIDETSAVSVTSTEPVISSSTSGPSASEPIHSTMWTSASPTTTNHANTTTPSTATNIPDSGASQSWVSRVLVAGATIVLV